MSTQHAAEIDSGNRFAFGENWAKFLAGLDEKNIAMTEQSLRNMLSVESLHGKRFLDIGSGSGLFSLAARRLGAVVHSFDYDPASVACTKELKARYFPDDLEWVVEQGSVLDQKYLASLGQWDVVYSWGVLHHTGNMWPALTNVSNLVSTGGKLFIALYNDQGVASKYWLKVKRLYNKMPPSFRWLVLWPAAVVLWGPTTIVDILKGRPFRTWRDYPKRDFRGMSPWRDIVDWVGGLPFEVARPDTVFHFYQDRGFRLERLKTCSGELGCNEFVFKRE